MNNIKILIALVLVCLAILVPFAGMAIDELLNLVLRSGEPSIGFRRLVSIKDRFRLACRLRNSSEKLEREYVAAIENDKQSNLCGITIILICFATIFVMDGLLHISYFYIIIIALIAESIGILYFFIGKISATEYEDGIIIKKSEKCEIVDLRKYHNRDTVEWYATVCMADHTEYRMIPVINCDKYNDGYQYPGADCVVYYRKLPMAGCCIIEKGEVL